MDGDNGYRLDTTRGDSIPVRHGLRNWLRLRLCWTMPPTALRSIGSGLSATR